MKNRRMMILSAALLGLAAAGTLQARDHKGPGDRKGPGGGPAWHEKFKDLMQKRFDLSDDQQAKLKEAFEAQRKAAEPLHKELRVGLAKLRWQVEAEADSKELAATLAQLDKTRKALQSQQDKFLSSLKNILTPVQQAKMLLAHMPQGGMRMGMGMAGPGMPQGFGPGMPGPKGFGPGMPGEGPEMNEDGPGPEEGPEE